MITVSQLKHGFRARNLFQDVNLSFKPGNCYGVIGANGAGKSTFLKLIEGKEEPNEGSISLPKGERLAVLEQNRDAYDDSSVIETVIQGHKELHKVASEKTLLYEKADFSDEDGLRVAELESEFAELGGWEAENQAEELLQGLGISSDFFELKMKNIEESIKVRVLLAQALFANPDNLLLDEPTNNLDIESIRWLEDFLYNFENTVVVVSHDRHFLNKVCTHIVDIDFQKINCYVGNYEFWSESSQLLRRQKRDQKKRAEDRAAELKSFIQRFSANASRSKQATARRKELEKLNLEELPSSSRRFPYVSFQPERSLGRSVIEIEELSYTYEGKKLFENLSLSVRPGDKIALIGPMALHKWCFLELLASNLNPQKGKIRLGQTVHLSYFPADNSSYFDKEMNMLDWLAQHAGGENEDQYLRSFLGRMLFSGDEALKSVKVLSGGEKVRCMLAKMMLSGANTLLFDHPSAHLDLEAIQSLNNALISFSGVIIFTSHDHQFISSVANRIIEFTPLGHLDRQMPFDDYLNSNEVRKNRLRHYGNQEGRIII